MADDFEWRPCPRCGEELRRVHRTALDHLVDRVVPVMRFRCTGRVCGWGGLLVSRRQLGRRLARHQVAWLVAVTALLALVLMRLVLRG